MKRSIFITLISFLLIGCTEDTVTLEKDDYLVYKEELLEQVEDESNSDELLENISKENDK